MMGERFRGFDEYEYGKGDSLDEYGEGDSLDSLSSAHQKLSKLVYNDCVLGCVPETPGLQFSCKCRFFRFSFVHWFGWCGIANFLHLHFNE
jgi:hypothetical protein